MSESLCKLVVNIGAYAQPQDSDTVFGCGVACQLLWSYLVDSDTHKSWKSFEWNVIDTWETSCLFSHILGCT